MIDSCSFNIKNKEKLLDNASVTAWIEYYYMFNIKAWSFQEVHKWINGICFLDRIYKYQQNIKEELDKIKEYEITKRLY